MVVKIERKRYFLVEFMGNVPHKRDLIRDLRENIALLGGQLSLARSSIHVIEVEDQFAIVRSTHQSRDLVEASIQLMNSKNCIPVVRTVSGTIAKINRILASDYQEPDDQLDPEP